MSETSTKAPEKTEKTESVPSPILRKIRIGAIAPKRPNDIPQNVWDAMSPASKARFGDDNTPTVECCVSAKTGGMGVIRNLGPGWPLSQPHERLVLLTRIIREYGDQWDQYLAALAATK